MTEKKEPTKEELKKQYEAESAKLGQKIVAKQLELQMKLNKLMEKDLKLMCVLEDIINDTFNAVARKCYLDGMLAQQAANEPAKEDTKLKESTPAKPTKKRASK